jgi:HEAT repeat protein
LVQLVLENFGDDCYIRVCNAIFPLIEKLLYDKSDEIRDRAISIVAEIRNVVNEKEKEHVMRLTLGLAHDDNEKLRESAVKLLNELAPDMG